MTNPPTGRIRTAMIGVSVALALVIMAPVLLSSQDLYTWGRTGLGLSPGWAWLVPVALDCAAMVCIGMTIVAAWRRERPGVFELLVWVFAGSSAYAQYRNGMTPAVLAAAPDAHLAFPAFALLGPVLLHVVLSRLRRWARADSGEQLTGAAGFGARWLPGVAFGETLRAWAASRREGIDTAAASIAYVREVRALRGLAAPDAVRYAWAALGHREPYATLAWLQSRGRQVTPGDLDQAAASAPPRVPSPPAAPTSPAAPGTADLSGPAYHRGQLAELPSKRAQIRYAYTVLGHQSTPGDVTRWLDDHGVTVQRSEAYTVGRTLDTPSGEYPTVPRPVSGPLAPVNGHRPALSAVPSV